MSDSKLEDVSQAVCRRLVLACWAALLTNTSIVTFGVLAAMLAGLALVTGKVPSLGALLGMILLWLLTTGIWAWLRRPSPTRSLAIWDERSGRHEVFVSAWCFERAASKTVGEEMHLIGALRLLSAEWPKLSAQLPISWSHRAWLAPLLFIVLWQGIRVFSAAPIAAGIAAEARERALDVAATLDEKVQQMNPLPGLDEAERKQVDELKDSVHEAAETMKDLADATPREAISALEQRARAAEKLAEALGEGGAEKLSAEMLAEMDRHADLADLSAALRADDAEKSSTAASQLADKLANRELSLEERSRITEALKKSLDAANEKDKQTEAGKHLDEATDRLKKKEPAAASKSLRDLAKSMSRRGQRKQSSKQLQQLAKNLRSAGQQIFGRQNNGLQRLAQNQPSPSRSGLQRAGSSANSIPLAQLMPGQPSPGQQGNSQRGRPQASANPGAASQPGAPSGQSGAQGQQSGSQPQSGAQAQSGSPAGQPSGAVPVPGAGSPNAPSAGQSAAAGGQQPGSGGIPVPGTQPGSGQSPGGQSAGAGAGQSPGAGQQAGAGQGSGAGQPGGGAPTPGTGGGPGSASGEGGLAAGVGSAPMGNVPTEAIRAAKQGVVKAQIGRDGASQARAIDPREHSEQAERSPREIAVEFLKVQEEALADEPLPASRREQVRRYFNALRQQLSDDAPKSEAKHDP